MERLRLIKDHIASSLSILPEDLDLTPFDRKGGLFGFCEAFGEQYKEILEEIRKSPQLLNQWERYRRQYEYAKEISFEDTCDTLQKLVTDIM